MHVLQGMSTDKMIIIFPAALIAMYLIISVQKYLCERQNPKIGLIVPILCFIVATVLAFRPMFVLDAAKSGELISFCLRMWLTFNIPTLVFAFPYYKQRRIRKANFNEASSSTTNLPKADDSLEISSEKGTEKSDSDS